MKRWLGPLLLAVWISLVATTARAEPPRLEAVWPVVGQAGTEFQQTLEGAGLERATELVFYRPGLACVRLSHSDEGQVTATIRAAADCPLGAHPFRVLTPSGFSEARLLRITPLAVIEEAEPNDTPQNAQRVPLERTITGAFDAAGLDQFLVDLSRGDVFSAEIEAARLGSVFSDGWLAVYGPDGRQLAAVDDAPLFRQDPCVTLRAEQSGPHRIVVREASFAGGREHRYALHIGRFLRPAAVFPLGGPAGELRLNLLFGGKLDPRSASVSSLKPKIAGGLFEFRWREGSLVCPTPNLLRVSPFGNVLEQEPNDRIDAAGAPVAIPISFNGVLQSPGDRDYFRFLAARNEPVSLRVYAARLGSPLDSTLTVYDPGGRKLAANDDSESHDSELTLTPPEAGELLVEVCDKRLGGGPEYVYRLEVDRPQPSLTVFQLSPVRRQQLGQAIAIPRGGRALSFLGVRRQGTDGPVRLQLRNLPSGVRAEVPDIPAGEYLVPVVFSADAEAPIAGTLVEVEGATGYGDQQVRGGFAQSAPISPAMGDADYFTLQLDRLAVAVCEPAPFALEVAPVADLVPVDGELDLEVTVARSPDFAGPIAVSFPVLPPGVEAPTSIVVPEGASTAQVRLLVHAFAPPGEGVLVATAAPAPPERGARDALLVGMNGLGGANAPPQADVAWTSSQPTALRLGAPPLEGSLDSVVAVVGKPVRVEFTLSEPASNTYVARLVGLPARTTAEETVLSAGDRSVTFSVVVNEQAPLGKHGVHLELEGQSAGRRVVYRVARGGEFRIVAPEGAAVDEAGRPLSRLDALRLRRAPNSGAKSP